MSTFYTKTGNSNFNKDLKNLFESKGFTKSTIPADIVFLSGEPAYYRNNFDLEKSTFVNVIQRPDITYKAKLYKKFKDYDFIPKTYKISDLPDTFLKIVKPADGYAGEGIRIIDNKEDLIKWTSDSRDWVIQEYINTPALKNGHKFHLRVHVLVIKDSVYLYNDMRYYVAKEKYIQTDWTNSDIHDTHYNPRFDNVFPHDLPDNWTTGTITPIKKIVKTVFEGIKLKPDWNGKNGYYIFGLDIMFNKKKPILLEVNDRVGLTEKSIPMISEIVDILQGNKPNLFIEVYPK